MQWTEAGGAVRDGGRHHDEVERGGHGPVAFSCRGCWRRHARRALPCASTHGSEAMADTDEQRNGVGRRQAEDAVRTLLRWAGDDPARQGLLHTPKRALAAHGEDRKNGVQGKSAAGRLTSEGRRIIKTK